MIHESLFNVILNDTESKFNNNDVKQWLFDKLPLLELSAVPSVSKVLARWFMSMPEEDFLRNIILLKKCTN